MTGYAAQPGTARIGHFQPGLAGTPLPAPPPFGMAVFSGGYARNPAGLVTEPPVLTPLAIPVTLTAGQWMFAVASWRQDGGIAGTQTYPSTVSISDDAGNFWIPVYTTQTGTTGVVRSAVWMAPAARPAQFVFFSPTNYQGGLVAQVITFTAQVPWYDVIVAASSFVNGSTDIGPLTLTPGVNQFTLGVVAWDNVTTPAVISPTEAIHHSSPASSLLSAVNGGTITWSANPATGAKVLVAIWSTAAETISTVVDNGTTPTTFTRDATATSTGGSVYIYRGDNITNPSAGSYAVTITGTGGAVVVAGGQAYTGVKSGGPTNSTNATGTGTAVSTGGSAPANAGALFFAAFADASALNPETITLTNANYVEQFTETNGSASHCGGIADALAGIGPYSSICTWTLGDSVAWTGLQVVYDAVSSVWTAVGTESVTNGSNTSGDMKQAIFYLNASPGVQVDLFGHATTTVDWSEVMIVVSGMTDVLPYPYGTPALEGWPVVVTEIAAGAVLNQDPTFAQGTTHWSGDGHTTLTAVSQPLFQPIPNAYQPALYGSVSVTTLGTAAFSTAYSSRSPVSVTTPYTAVAWVYSPQGYGNGVTSGAGIGIHWQDGGGGGLGSADSAPIQLLPGEWTLLSLPSSYPVAGTVQAQAVVYLRAGTGNVSASAVFYIGYAAFSEADSYEGTPPDEIAWTDISSRVFTHGPMEITRGIQYEQQSLEAGTLSLYVDNHDGAFTFGNVLSPYYPNVGDTDVPIRVRAVWPGSLTPYVMLFSGYTDDIVYGVDRDTRYGFAQIQASDAWSRLTQQMLGLAQNEALVDNPVAFISCNQTGGNTISLGPYSAPALSILATNGQVPITTPPVANFTGGAIAVPGASGLSCWQSSGTKAANPGGGGLVGYTLAWLPNNTLVVSGGVTIEFWWSPVSVNSTQAVQNITICQALSGQNSPVWLLYAQNSTPAQTYIQFIRLQIFDVSGNLTSDTIVGTTIPPYATTALAAQSYYISVAFNRSTITVTVNPGGLEGTLTETLTLTGQTLDAECTGFTFGGGLGEQAAFGDTAIADIAVYASSIPAARTVAHYQAGLTAFVGESDNWRLARIAGYSGFIPVLGMRGLDLTPAPSADVDTVTGATDTNTQVASAYFTNVAASTLAVMFVNGAGTLIYRRRLDWYNRPIAQYVLGENDSQLLSTGLNPLNLYNSISGWTGANGATLSTGGAVPAAGPEFVPYSAVFVGDGVTANPAAFASSGTGTAATPGQWYTVSAWVYSPQGWSSGVFAAIHFHNSGGGLTTAGNGPTVGLAAGSVAFITSGPLRADVNAAFANAFLAAQGTPPSSVHFYIAGVVLTQVTPDYAGGANVAVPEAPYASDFKMSSDRAQLFNYAVLSQYGTNLISAFSGTSVLFTPNSGVIVLVSNDPSIAARGQIPYTATLYLNNTAQATPYELNVGSMEDHGAWITQTLGSPLFRPDSVTLTPAATPAALTTAVQAEVGDTILFRRRALGAPEVQMLTYLSKLTHTIDISSGSWNTQMDLSPFPGGSILTCDDVVFGVLTGQNLLGW